MFNKNKKKLLTCSDQSIGQGQDSTSRHLASQEDRGTQNTQASTSTSSSSSNLS